MAKRVCTVSREAFSAGARAVTVELNEHERLIAHAKQFSSGSFGWYANGKVELHLADGTVVECQVGLNITVIGSKELAQQPQGAAA